jgi:RimJ/RimL family protein N-acetyltransferase
MNKICCKVYSFNSRSIRLLSKIGFTLEGTAREHEYNEITGKFVDVHFFGLLYREYPNEFVKKILEKTKYEYAEK